MSEGHILKAFLVLIKAQPYLSLVKQLKIYKNYNLKIIKNGSNPNKNISKMHIWIYIKELIKM